MSDRSRMAFVVSSMRKYFPIFNYLPFQIKVTQVWFPQYNPFRYTQVIREEGLGAKHNLSYDEANVCVNRQ
jgi:hypothetical protein